MDVHVPRAVTVGLRLRGVDVRTAQADDSAGLDDAALLIRARTLDRVLVSQDEDLLRIGAEFLQAGDPFSGIVYAHQLRVPIGQMVADLALIAAATLSEDWRNQIVYLPLD